MWVYSEQYFVYDDGSLLEGYLSNLRIPFYCRLLYAEYEMTQVLFLDHLLFHVYVRGKDDGARKCSRRHISPLRPQHLACSA
jgi:hypothetical protein